MFKLDDHENHEIVLALTTMIHQASVNGTEHSVSPQTYNTCRPRFIKLCGKLLET